MIRSYVYYLEGELINLIQRNYDTKQERNFVYFEDGSLLDMGWYTWSNDTIAKERKEYPNMKIVQITNKEFVERVFVEVI